MDYTVTLTVTELGYDDDNGPLLIDALQRLAPGVEPVLVGSHEDGWLLADLSIEARDAGAAIDEARSLLKAAIAEAGLATTCLVAVEAARAAAAA